METETPDKQITYMRTFETLYKRTRTGAIQQWSIVADDSLDGYSYIMKAAGQLGGKLTHHNEHIREGKNIGKSNETTQYDQACLQAESDWKRKHDEGYKSLVDLGIYYNGDYARVDGQERSFSLAEALDLILPQFNADANGNVKPMLAKDWDGGKKVKYPCYIQPKLDGVRCLMVINVQWKGKTKNTTVKYLSRSGKEYTTLGHITHHVLTSSIVDSKETIILDGEIYSDELTFQEITQAVKKQYPNSLKLHFRAYDVVSNQSQQDRIGVAKKLVSTINSPLIHWVFTTVAVDQEEVKNFHDKWVQDGYEGAIIRHSSGIYAQGQRSSDLLKVKEFNENEYKLIGFEYGQRGVEDLIAVCEKDDKEFRAKMQGSKAVKQAIVDEHLTNDELITKVLKLTVKHFGYTDDGLPRFPIGKSIRNYE
jgi:ATP-dependent DNA ligase